MWNRGMTAILMILACCLCILGISTVNKSQETVAERIYCEKTVAITFDDGPSSMYTGKLLDGLRERGVRATFFLVGENIVGNEDLVRQMHEDGHLICNHTYSHVVLTKLKKEEALEEINSTNRLIKDITGEMPRYIRPPCGEWNNELLYEVNMTPILWSVDPMDWCTYNAGCVADRVIDAVKDGDIILLHDIYDTSVAAALEIIDRLKTQGYVFVTVDEVIIE